MALQLPSASNTTGTLLGTLAGTAVGAAVSSMPWEIATAGWLSAALGASITPVALAGLLAVIATAGVNYGVTHIAEIKNLNGLVAAYWPQIVTTYPTGKNGTDDVAPVSNGQPNANFNKVADGA